MISPDLILFTVKERFGSALAESPGFVEELARVLRGYVPYRDTLSSFSRKLEDCLFNALYERLGPEMTIQRDDGTVYRIYISDLPSLADDMLFPLFASFPSTFMHYCHLHDYWMETGSFSAMRALYLCFQRFLPSQEAALIRRIVQENLPIAQQKSWFSVPGISFSP